MGGVSGSNGADGGAPRKANDGPDTPYGIFDPSEGKFFFFIYKKIIFCF